MGRKNVGEVMGRPGRPLKYTEVFTILEDNQLYSAASIVRLAEQRRLFSRRRKLTLQVKKDGLATVKRRIRLTLNRLQKNHQFPVEGDGLLTIPGQRPTAAWFGWRWKRVAVNKLTNSKKEVLAKRIKKHHKNII